ncbi:hypothetical protein LTS18_000554, partial [Coniosporium uncinatum]
MTTKKIKLARPISRRPVASASSRLYINKKRREYNPLDAEEERKWLERARSESAALKPSTPEDAEDNPEEDGDYVPIYRTTSEFMRRFPEAENFERQSMVAPPQRPFSSPAPRPQPPPQSYASPMPSMPSRPAPAMPRNFCARLKQDWGFDQQQDAKEFFDFLIDYLHEDLNTQWNNPPAHILSASEEAAREKMPKNFASRIEWSRYSKREMSIVSKLFAGQHASRLRCRTCGITSTT